ncbi:SOS response-associated peptidase family protein [Chitinivorax sp. B]|uniref:SOS response-associated peptidase family protein n=1 Tax=Chitinivorax sp. B TaxID=2502235 RepID=UPI0010F6D3D7|nr:SOS response-associated peptidase family protein [Chitinivorax sp. B]
MTTRLGQLRSFKRFWADGHLAITAVKAFFEPNYESGHAVRWRIHRTDGQPLLVASLWRTWPREEGGLDYSFSLITASAAAHPLLKRMHKPEDEKRTLAIIPPEECQNWLQCRDPEVARTFLRPAPAAALSAELAPLPPRNRLVKPGFGQ